MRFRDIDMQDPLYSGIWNNVYKFALYGNHQFLCKCLWNVLLLSCFSVWLCIQHVFNDLFHRLIKRFNESLIKSEMSIPEVKWGYELATFLEMTV